MRIGLMQIRPRNHHKSRAARNAAASIVGLLLVVPAVTLATQAQAQEVARDAATGAADDLPGMVRISGTTKQPMGMSEANVKKALSGDMGRKLKEKDWDQFPFLWDFGFTFMTPQHTVTVGEYFLARFELTNAQWELFIDAAPNQATTETEPDDTLQSLVKRLYGFDTGNAPVDAQRAGLYLYHRNEAALAPVLNPDSDAKWEPLKAWVDNAPIKAGLTIDYVFILPPPYWLDGELPNAERDLPVRYLSWNDAREFCRWAGLHLPLEREWERAARGNEGRRYHWGDAWDSAAVVHLSWPGFEGAPGPQAVNSLSDFATPEGIHHLSGNVSEYVFDIARKYAGSKSKFKFESSSMLARGGSWKDEDYAMLAADRIWDMGSTQIGPDSRAEVFGFRTAGYSQGGHDLVLELAAYATEFNRMDGAAHWLPDPIGLSEKQRTKRDKRQELQGFSVDRAAGWMKRRVDADAANHAYVTGAAQGIALLPIKGVVSTFMKTPDSLTKWSLDTKETAFVGALVTTDKCTITLEDKAGKPVTIDMGDMQSDAWSVHNLGFTYQVGLWLVLRGGKVAVYYGDGTAAGIRGRHLKGSPLGFLPANWESQWVDATGAQPSGSHADGIATLSVPIPMLDRDGVPKRGKATELTIHVPVTFTD